MNLIQGSGTWVVVLTFTFIVNVNGGSISSSLLTKLQFQETADAVLELPSVMTQVLDNLERQNLTGDRKVSTLISLLKESTSASQAPFMSRIRSLGLSQSAQSFYIVNRISLKSANLSVLQSLSNIPGEFTIREPILVQLDPILDLKKGSSASPPPTAGPKIMSRQAPVEYGVSKINAPLIWSTKTQGEGVLVAGIDTGVFQNHEALRNNYGNGWFDAINGRTQPYDDNGHGSHTMGTILGSNGIGVAPRESEWLQGPIGLLLSP